jgi:prevent-host-death family protein
MKAAPVTDLKNRLSHYLRLVARGETITVLDRGKPVAQLVPPGEVSADLHRLVQTGLARLPRRKAVKDLWQRPLPRARVPVSEALQQDREDRLG